MPLVKSMSIITFVSNPDNHALMRFFQQELMINFTLFNIIRKKSLLLGEVYENSKGRRLGTASLFL